MPSISEVFHFLAPLLRKIRWGEPFFKERFCGCGYIMGYCSPWGRPQYSNHFYQKGSWQNNTNSVILWEVLSGFFGGLERITGSPQWHSFKLNRTETKMAFWGRVACVTHKGVPYSCISNGGCQKKIKNMSIRVALIRSFISPCFSKSIPQFRMSIKSTPLHPGCWMFWNEGKDGPIPSNNTVRSQEMVSLWLTENIFFIKGLKSSSNICLK